MTYRKIYAHYINLILFITTPLLFNFHCVDQYQSEGTLNSPKALTFASLPYTTGTVDNNGFPSYYAISGLSPGVAYEASLTNIQGKGLPTISYNLTKNGQENLCTASCVFGASADTIYITVSNFMGNGAGFTLNITASNLPANWGDYSTPYPVSINSMPYSTSMNTKSYFLITDLIPGTAYTITGSGSTSPLEISNISTSNCIYPSTSTDSCTFGAAATSLTISVGQPSNGTSSGGGTFFSLNTVVAPNALASYGNSTTRYVIPGTALPVQSSVAESGTSYYTITGLTANSPYTIHLTGLSNILSVSISGTTVENCSTAWYNLTYLVCQFSPSGTEVDVDISTTTSGSAFTLNLTGMYPAEGSIISPMVLAFSIPHSGTVDTGSSYYVVNGLTPNTPYFVSLYRPKGSATFNLYNDAFFLNQAYVGTNQGYNTQIVQTDAIQTSLYIRVNGGLSIAGSSYFLMIKPLPVNEGSRIAPIALTYAAPSLNYAGQVAAPIPSISYYAISNLTIGTTYNIYLTDLASDADLTVFGADSSFTTTVCASSEPGSKFEKCQWLATWPTLYFRVDRFSPLGSYFSIQIN